MKFKHTKLPIELSFPKLVRDKIPEIIKKSEGKKTIVRKAKNDEEYLKFVLKKIVEEAVEVQSCKSKDDFINELGDLEELITEVMKLKIISKKEIERVNKEKMKVNGSFSKRLIFKGKK